MAQLEVDETEIHLIMLALNSLEDASLTEDGKTVRAGLAYKLGAANADIIIEERSTN